MSTSYFIVSCVNRLVKLLDRRIYFIIKIVFCKATLWRWENWGGMDGTVAHSAIEVAAVVSTFIVAWWDYVEIFK